ncbi:MAG TPA: serine/threonine-protein kinase [Polyangiaceae bacterium]
MERARARLGRTLRDKWRLDSLLGVGGMAAVYAATHRNGSRAAVKVLHPELTAHPEARARFLREGYAANAVGHEGAVRVLDDDVAEDGSLFLVTELLDGETLEDRRSRMGGRLTEDEVLNAADQVLDVLAAAHEKGVVHRDLKPENVFVTAAGKVKVLDFGIARLRELQPGAQATKSGMTMGTPAFMPPEQALGLWNDVDATSDLWAVGATMFALLSGAPVHDGRTGNEVLLAAMTRPAPPLASVVPGISPFVAQLVDEALAFDKRDRWQDAQSMQAAVQSAYHRRYGAPLHAASRLHAPSTIRAGALPPGPDALPATATLRRTTAPPVVSPSTPPTLAPGAATASRPPSSIDLPRTSRPALVAMAVGAVLALGAAATGVVALRFADHLPGAASTSAGAAAASFLPAPSTPASAGPIPAPPTVAPATTPTPTVAATDLPVAPSAAPAASAASARPPLRAKPRVVAPKAGCTPPYEIDPATGKKKWKEECL